MIDVASTGIGRAAQTIADNAGKGNKGEKFRVYNNTKPGVTSFASFFQSRTEDFTENMAKAAENQANGQSNGRNN